MKLGRIKPSEAQKERAPKLARYLRAPLAPAPDALDCTTDAAYFMYANDRLGDCTCAGLANYFATVAAREGSCLAFAEQDVVDFYMKLGDGQDRGLVESDVLDHAKANGFPLSGERKLAVWVSVDPRDVETVKSLAATFWCLYLGIELPLTAQTQEVWDVGAHRGGDAAPGSWGGHCVVLPKYDPRGPTFITWGAQKRATWRWWSAYVDEVYCLLDADRAALIGVDWNQLLADIQAGAQS